MTYRMFIDDERDPPEDGDDWITVRSSQAAIDLVKKEGLPHYISFDHDLGGEDTAHNFLKWVIGYHLDRRLKWSIDYYIHSQNPVGAGNIRGIIESFKRNV